MSIRLRHLIKYSCSYKAIVCRCPNFHLKSTYNEEDLALSQAPTDCTPHMWKRYVDDTFCILKKGTVEKLLSHLNSLQPTIQFTVVIERDGSVPFLDTLLQRK